MIKLWPHRDQAPNLQTFACVQGQLNLRSNLHPTDGGLVLYPGTHTIDWGARYPKSTNYSNHYYSPPYDEAETSPSNARVIRSPAGSLIIWDSRLIHCNRPPSPQSGSTRAVVYICMMPRSLATEATLKERIELHKKHCTTGHWPHELVVNGDGGFLSGSKVSGKEVMKVVRRREVYGVRDPVVRRLVGYDSGEPTVMEAVGNVVAGAVGWFKT
ncbi:hypothetical protein HK104_004922 [Borealophlyctis nickersoniae]|nr:hypothetical protein HK104_004922 [Borealophlyctis nickersoniae]